MAVFKSTRLTIGPRQVMLCESLLFMEAMLAGEAYSFNIDWQDLEILAPVKDYKARHNSIMLPFEAVEKAFLKGTKI
ncbi:MAG: hypothetical protein AABY97_02110 [Chloroflexota bacterium]